MESKWARQQRKTAESLFGAIVIAWHGTEMAIRDEGPDGLSGFEVGGVQCLQLSRLELELADHELVRLSTYQSEDHWGLQISRSAELAEFQSDVISRGRVLSDLPVGEIDAVSVRRTVPHLDVAEVVLEIAGEQVTLIAGETEEQASGRLAFRWLNESVLVFTDPAAIEANSWTPPRRFVEHRTPYRRIDSAGTALGIALATTAIGADVDDDELVRTFGIHVERMWRSEMQQFGGWPAGHTTDGSSVHVCYRPTPDTIEVLGVTWFDFGPTAFPFRARFSSLSNGLTKTIAATEIDERNGGPKVRADSPVLLAVDQPESARRSAEIMSGGRQTAIEWVDVIELTEDSAATEPKTRLREIEHSIPWSDQLDDQPAVGAVVGQLLPAGFDCYVRVFHPFARWEADSVARTPEPKIASWTELATSVGLELGPSLTLRQLDTAIEALEPERGRMAIWEGELEESTADVLYRTVNNNEQGPFLFAFGLTTIIASASHEPMLFEAETLSRRAEIVEAVRDAGATRATTAECVWPHDRQWIVFTDYDLTSTYVACSAERADRILSSNQLEAVLVNRATRIDDHADEQSG